MLVITSELAESMWGAVFTREKNTFYSCPETGVEPAAHLTPTNGLWVWGSQLMEAFLMARGPLSSSGAPQGLTYPWWDSYRAGKLGHRRGNGNQAIMSSA